MVTLNAVELIPWHSHAVLAPLGADRNQSLSGVLPRLTSKPPPTSVNGAAHSGEVTLKEVPVFARTAVLTVVHVSPCATGAWKYPTMSITTSVFPAPWLRTVSSFDSRPVELDAVTVPVEIVVPAE